LGASATRAVGGDLLGSRLAVGGLHCAACAWLIERAARLEPGWHSARVRMNDHCVDIVFDPKQVQLSKIAARLGQLGYRLSPMVVGKREAFQAAENRRLLVQIAIAGFLAANSMWIAVALYAGQYSGIEQEHATLLRWAGVLLGFAAVAIPGRIFFQGAWASLRTWTPHMDLPVALGLGVGSIAGIASAISGAGEVYFDSIAVLVFFLLVGRWVQFRQQRQAAESVGLLLRLAPRNATRIEADGTLRTVPTDSLRGGDMIRVIAGEGVPADGNVVKGQSTLDRSLLTGESRPVPIAVGDEVHAGTANIESPLDVCVTQVGLESRAGKLMQMVEDAAQAKAPVVQLADSIGGWFVCIVIVLALFTLIAWWSTSPSEAAEHAVALLIVACPCALALATPLALAVGLGRAARRRLLVRGGDVFEKLAKPGIVWFDKTGTLTEGRLRVTRVEGGPDENTLLAQAAALEVGSKHPIAKGIVAEAARRGCALLEATDVRQDSGGGVKGIVLGKEVRIGNLAYLRAAGVKVTDAVVDAAERIASAGATPVMISVDGFAKQVLCVEDVIREDANDVVQRLRKSGWRVGMLSGDHPKTVAHVAEQLGIEPDAAFGGLSPEEKLNRIEGSKREGGGAVVMVGDGVNDAVALAAADVGVAVRGGAEASLEAAPVFLADGRLSGLADLTYAARSTVKVIRRNFAASLGYNVLAVVLAMAGWINPLMAAVLMPISSLTVLSLTLASPTFQRGVEQGLKR
jgi:P-type Cu2+ transporter